jgi:hypothetical protein
VLTERQILVDKKYSDARECFKSLNSVLNLEAPEQPFSLQKSTLTIFRFEDVLFNVYPHLAQMRRKGMTIKEIFLKNDPLKESSTFHAPSMSNQANLTVNNYAPGSQLEVTSQKSHFGDSSKTITFLVSL